MTEKELVLFKDIKEDLIKLQHKIDNIITSQSQTLETKKGIEQYIKNCETNSLHEDKSNVEKEVKLESNHSCKKCKRSNEYMNCMSISCITDLLHENNCPYFIEKSHEKM